MDIEVVEVEGVVKNVGSRKWDYAGLKAILTPVFQANIGKMYAIKENDWMGFLNLYSGNQSPRIAVRDSVSRCLRGIVGNKNISSADCKNLVFFNNTDLVIDTTNLKL